jgi:hypothetical protein
MEREEAFDSAVDIPVIDPQRPPRRPGAILPDRFERLLIGAHSDLRFQMSRLVGELEIERDEANDGGLIMGSADANLPSGGFRFRGARGNQ